MARFEIGTASEFFLGFRGGEEEEEEEEKEVVSLFFQIQKSRNPIAPSSGTQSSPTHAFP